VVLGAAHVAVPGIVSGFQKASIAVRAKVGAEANALKKV